jgi:hypothetical protein
MLQGQSAIGSPMRDAAPEQVRAERLWGFGAEQLSIPVTQINDAHFGQQIEFRLDLWFGRVMCILTDLRYEETPDFVIR